MSETTLYRKYRPQNFADLIGQDHIAQTLRSEVQHGQCSHAYLFSGPRGVGKTTTARLLAKAANCASPKLGEPDGTCPACTSIRDGKTLDVIEIDAASYTGVDSIREIIEHSRFTPSQLKYKVFIVDEVHMLSTAAFNALLKTLEEPPSHVIFILATTELHKVPETILSRCQRFDFRRLQDADLATRLRWITKQEKRSVDDEVIDAIVRVADGSSRDAEGVLGQLFALGEKHITKTEADIVLPRSNLAAVGALVQALLSNNQPAALQQVAEQLENGVDLEAFRTDVIRTLRDCLLFRLLPAAQHPALPVTLHEVVSQTPAPMLVRSLEAFLDVAKYVSISPLPQLPLELAVLNTTTATEPRPLNTPVPMTPAPKTQKTIPPTPAPSSLWQKTVADVSAQVPMLAFSLQAVRCVTVTNDALDVAGPYALHIERLNHPKAKAVIDEMLARNVNHPVALTIRHDPSVTLDAPKPIPHNTAGQTSAPPAITNPDQLWDQIVNALNT